MARLAESHSPLLLGAPEALTEEENNVYAEVNNDRYMWPRVCENPNSKTQSGESKPIHGFFIKHVGFMNTVQWYSRPFIYRHPNINECQKVFTRPRPHIGH
jgi:hypothetical protein